MLNNIITFALQQRIFVLVATVVLICDGWYAFQRLPVEAFPDVQDVQVQVITQALGQAPAEIERTITLPIEREMNGVPRLIRLRSVSITGLSVITLTFADNTNDYFARQQVMEKLQNVTLPPNIQATMAPLTNSVGEVYRYILEAPSDTPRYEVRALQDWIVRPTLRTVPNVADVVSFGGGIKEYQVRLNPALLRKYNITIDQVAQALTNNSSNAGGGLLTRGDEALVIRGIGLFTRLEDVGRVTIASRNGQPILVNQVGEVAIGERTRSGIVAFNGQDSIVQGIVLMTKGQNPSIVVEDVKKKIEELSPKLPKGIRLVPYYDRTTLVNHTIHTVGENLIVGAVLVVTILVVFLRNWRASLSVAAVIPLSLLFAFILMDARGVSANLISLGTVDFGIIIDSAVVLVEALMVKLTLTESDEHPTDYSGRLHTLRYTVLDLGRPILFSKAIIILAFMPIFTFQRVEGKIFTPMAYTLSFALLGAILLTITLVPALISFTLKNHTMVEKHNSWMHGLQKIYRSGIEKASQYRATVISGAVAALLASLTLIPVLGSEFLPKLDEGNIWLTITLPPSTSLDKTKDVERHVRGLLKTYPEVKSVVTQVGRPDDGTDPKGPNNMEVLADLKPRETWRFPTKETLIADMTKKIQAMPGIPTNFSQVIQDNVEEALSGVKGEIAVKIFGPDLEILEEKSEQIASILHGIKGSADVAAIKIGGQSEVTITLNREQMARYGINIIDVNNTVQTALGGSTVNSFFEGERRFDVTLRLAKPFRDAVDDVAELPIALPGGSGNTIPLATIANIEVRQGATRISREAGGRNVSVKANLLGRDQGSFVKEAMNKVGAQVRLPPGYYITWGGQFENQQRAMKRLQIIVPLSLLSIFILLFWAFRSLGQALLVMLLIPFIMIGGLIGLKLAHLHLSISAAVGFIALAGISVQNGVIMVEEIMRIIRNGKDMSQAVIEGAALRLRPIIMTALMAGLGLLPAALSHGIGSETQRPFAVVIVGGIVSATFFTLLLQPVLFPLFSKERESSDN